MNSNITYSIGDMSRQKMAALEEKESRRLMSKGHFEYDIWVAFHTIVVVICSLTPTRHPTIKTFHLNETAAINVAAQNRSSLGNSWVEMFLFTNPTNGFTMRYTF